MNKQKLKDVVEKYERDEDLTDVLSFLARAEYWPKVGVKKPVGGLVIVDDENITTYGETVKVAVLRYLDRL
jgi:hypothetical protein